MVFDHAVKLGCRVQRNPLQVPLEALKHTNRSEPDQHGRLKKDTKERRNKQLFQKSYLVPHRVGIVLDDLGLLL